MRTRPGALLTAALGLWLTVPAPADAQIKGSERSTVSQTVDGTTLTIDYSRPRARGRSGLFGEIVWWGKVWTPGANQATTLEVDKDVEIDGHPVPAGKYSVWMVVEDSSAWELVLDPRTELFHTQGPEETEDQIRFMVPRVEATYAEALTWSVPTYTTSSMRLEMRWGTTMVPLEVAVEPSQRIVVTAEEAAPIVGRYQARWLFGQDEDPEPVEFVVTRRDDGTLRGVGPSPNPQMGETWELMLLPLAEGIFLPGSTLEGELAGTFDGMTFEFLVGDGPAPSFEFRSESDRLFGTGERAGG